MKLFEIVCVIYIGICCAKGETHEAKVLILGAGTAGISAAQRLEEKGMKDFLVIEGSDRVGGRIREARLGDYNVEVGSLWIHGGEDNPVYHLAKKYNVSVMASDYEDYIVRNVDGMNRTAEYDAAYEVFEPALEAFYERTEKMLQDNLADASQRSVLRQNGWYPTTPEDHIVTIYDLEFETGVQTSEMTTKYNAPLAYEDDDHMALNKNGGYSQMLRGMADEMFSDNDVIKRLYLNTVVTKIHQNNSHVVVTTKAGDTFIGERVISTFSLGVMQHRLVEFEPELPQWKWDSLFAFDFVTYLLFYLQFPTTFWDENEYILYATPHRGYMPIWLNFNKVWPGSNIIQCSVMHDEARQLLLLSDDELKASAMEALRSMYGTNIPDATGIVLSRWTTDPLFMGMYSNWPSGFSKDSHTAMGAHVGRIHFAGEHLHIQYGYVQGALFSGQITVDEVTACMGNAGCSEYRPPYEARGCTYDGAANYVKDAKEDDGSCQITACNTAVTNAVMTSWMLAALLLCHLF